jgi:protein O-mannosyl-transferase
MSKKRALIKQKKQEKQQSKFVWTMGIILALLAAALYVNTLGHGYALDDSSAIEENFLVQRGFDGVGDLMKTTYRYGYWNEEGTLYRPLSLVMFAIEYDLFGGSTSAHHFFNLLFYALTALLLFRVLKQIFNRTSILIPFFITAIFIAHPIHTEVVANIKSRDEIMAFLLALCSFFYFLKYLDSGKMRDIAVAMIAYFISFLSKESTVTFLVVYPLIYYYRNGYDLKKLLQFTGLFAIPAFVYILIRMSIIGEVNSIDNLLIIENVLAGAESDSEYYATAFLLLGKYLKMAFLPWPMSSDYSFPEIGLASWSNPYTWIALLLYLAIAVSTIFGLRKRNYLALGAALFIITLSIYSNLAISIGASFGERFLYVPVLGVAITIVFLLDMLFKTKKEETGDYLKPFKLFKKQGLFTVIIAVLVLLSSFATIDRNMDWKDSFTLYQTDVLTCPNSSRLHHFYGIELVQEKSRHATDPKVKAMYLDSAIAELHRAKDLYEPYSNSYERLGYCMTLKGNNVQAIEYYEKAIELNPTNSLAYNNVGKVYFEQKDLENAIRVYEKAVELNPRFGDAYYNLGSVYGTIGRFQASVDNFKKCIIYDPTNATAHYFCGLSLQSLNKGLEANKYFQKAKQLDPKLNK